jgi:hypothetical protein
VDRIHLAEDMDHWFTVVSTVLNVCCLLYFDTVVMW